MSVCVDEAWQNDTIRTVRYLCIAIPSRFCQDGACLLYCDDFISLHHDGAVDDDPPTGVHGDDCSMAVDGRDRIHGGALGSSGYALVLRRMLKTRTTLSM